MSIEDFWSKMKYIYGSYAVAMVRPLMDAAFDGSYMARAEWLLSNSIRQRGVEGHADSSDEVGGLGTDLRDRLG